MGFRRGIWISISVFRAQSSGKTSHNLNLSCRRKSLSLRSISAFCLRYLVSRLWMASSLLLRLVRACYMVIPSPIWSMSIWVYSMNWVPFAVKGADPMNDPEATKSWRLAGGYCSSRAVLIMVVEFVLCPALLCKAACAAVLRLRKSAKVNLLCFTPPGGLGGMELLPGVTFCGWVGLRCFLAYFKRRS